jgi:hypothetical protein
VWHPYGFGNSVSFAAAPLGIVFSKQGGKATIFQPGSGLWTGNVPDGVLLYGKTGDLPI